MRIIAACTILLTIGVLFVTAAGVDGEPASLVLTARIVRGAVEDLPPLEQGVFRVLEEKELAELRKIYEAVPGGESVARMTAGDPGGATYRFSLTDLVRISYVADFDATVGSDGPPKPMRKTIREGAILDIQATPAPGRDFVTFEVRVTHASLLRPIPTFMTSIGAGPPLTIELPELSVTRTKESIKVPANRWAGYRAARDTLILVGAEATPAGGGHSDLAPDHRPR